MQSDAYLQNASSDQFPFYPRCAINCLGLIQILMGCLSFAVGISGICTLASGYYIGYGLWCGFIFVLAGIFCIVSATRRTSCAVFTAMSISVLTGCCAAAQVALGIVAADIDGKRKSEFNPYPVRDEWDIFFDRQNRQSHMCAGSWYTYTWANAWGAVDVLLILAGFIQLFCSISVAIFGCHAACCGKRLLSYMPYYPYHTAGGFSNEAYMTESRMSPPLYKVAA